MKARPLLAEISAGELIDKITILRIKTERIGDQEKLKNIRHELDLLNRLRRENLETSPALDDLEAQLKKVNEVLWDLEDDIRDYELRDAFEIGFIDTARAIYRSNDERASIKRKINELTRSSIVEEKSYTVY